MGHQNGVNVASRLTENLFQAAGKYCCKGMKSVNRPSTTAASFQIEENEANFPFSKRIIVTKKEAKKTVCHIYEAFDNNTEVMKLWNAGKDSTRERTGTKQGHGFVSIPGKH